MTDYGIVKSAVRPEAKVVDEYSVWVNSDITKKCCKILNWNIAAHCKMKLQQ